MNIHLIATGHEVLTGQIIDTNSAWLADFLSDHGFVVIQHSTIGDDLSELVTAFEFASSNSDIVIVSGGLGPTCDDLTASAAAELMGVPLERNSQWYARLEQFAANRGRLLTLSNEKQAWLPRGATLIDNPVGTACGFRLQHNQSWIVFTPGVPHEFKRMIKKEILPWLYDLVQPNPCLLKRFTTFGVSESSLADRIACLPKPINLTLGFRAQLPIVEVKLLYLNDSLSEYIEYQERISELLSDCITSDCGEDLFSTVHNLLIAQNKTISLAESCSGGMLANGLVNLAGSSHYLLASMVTYSNQAKIEFCGVLPETIDRYGAVSEETALEMATGARKRLQSDYALAITGVAGPDGGSLEKPVGTVAFSLVTRTKNYTQTLLFKGRSRQQIRAISCAVALDMLRRELISLPVICGYESFKKIEVE